MESNIKPLIESTFGFKSIEAIVSNGWGVMFSVGAIAAFLYSAAGAVEWITGGGDKARVERAKDRITQGMIGLGVLAVSWAVALLVQQFLGLNIFAGGSGGNSGDGGNGTCNIVGTQCRNQDCHFYQCTNGQWVYTGAVEPTCAANPTNGCYGVNPGFDPNATP